MSNRMLTVVFVAVTAISSAAICPAGGAPPVSRPQACAASFCVEVIPQVPHLPYQIETTTDLEGYASRLIVRLKGGGAVAFHARVVERRQAGVSSSPPIWKYEGGYGIASACLTCMEPNRRRDEVLGIAVTGTPHVRSKHLTDGMEVCYWSLDMSAAGYGTGRSMSLGSKVCVDDK